MTLLAAMGFENVFSVLRVADRKNQNYSSATEQRKR
jgi:hypothetical protein